MNVLRIALAQINTTVGDLYGNADKILDYIGRAKEEKADVVVFPELAITGYPPEDLLLKPSFVQDNLLALQRVAAGVEGITAVVGFVDSGEDIYNAAAVIHNGQIAGIQHKIYLPTYGVFDEDRYFQRGDTYTVFSLGHITFGVVVCEDMWYPDGPHRPMALLGDAQVIISINASPYHAGKWRQREQMLGTRASDDSCVVAYLNAVGGQDELVFDGQSVIVDPSGNVVTRGKAFAEDLIICDVDTDIVTHKRFSDPRRRKEKLSYNGSRDIVKRVSLGPLEDGDRKPICRAPIEPLGRVQEVYEALKLGTHDYVVKNGFKHVVLGLSGGIDSALTAAIAVDALGPEAVTAVNMPSAYSSQTGIKGAEDLARNLGIEYLAIPIGEIFDTYREKLADVFKGTEEGVTEENLQARIRGNTLMALSNKFGWIVLTTGNKSELATGYSTLYGDMAGGFGVLKDVPKTLVYELSQYRNTISPVIPEDTIVRPPSAELRPDQVDQDTLPPYPLLDAIVHAYVEEDRSVKEMIDMGFDEATVRRVVRLIDRNEYKRRQAYPGVKITPKAFGRDRRLPITNKYQ